MNELFHTLCTTLVGTDVSASLLAEGFRSIRAHNSRHAVSGLLVFDGSSCLHYLEGAEAKVRSAVAQVRNMMPGESFKLLYEGPFTGPRMFSVWAVGYPRDAEPDLLQRVEALQGAAAMQVLSELYKELDLDSGFGLIRISSEGDG